jgi:predicted outer membrane repeat protein
MKKQILLLVVAFINILIANNSLVNSQTILTNPPQTIVSLAWSPNGQYLAQLKSNGTLQVLQAGDLSVVFNFNAGVSQSIFRGVVTWSNDGSKLSAGIEQNIYIWTAPQFQLTHTLIGGGGVALVSTEGDYRIPEGFLSLVWNQASNQLMAQSISMRLTLWSYPSGNLILDTRIRGPQVNYVWLPDESGFTNGTTVYLFGGVEVTPLNRNRITEATNLGGETYTSINYLNTLIARLGVFGGVEIVNAITGNSTAFYQINPNKKPLTSASWSSDGQKLAIVDDAGRLYLLNTQSGSITLLNTVNGKLFAVSWNPVNNQIAFGGVSNNNTTIASVVSSNPIACTHNVTASSTSSLISAIVSANASSTPSTICLGGGTYNLTAVNNSDESPNGLPSITKNITIIGNNSVIERATSAPQFRIFRVASNGRLSLNNLTIRGGHAGSLSGGGVRNLGILELNTVIVENNTGNAGGGIRNNNNATFTAINSLIRNNVSTTNGGGLYANNGSSTTLTNTNFLANTTNASNGLGGAIFSNGNIFTMSGGIIQNNSARNGGGIFVNITTQAMSLNGVQFTGNTASNHGAGIYHLSGTTFSVQNGRFTSNIATNEGGAIAGDGTFTITNSNFISNSANIGGAIHAQATSGSSIQQSCLENNTAPNTIGIFNEASVILNAQNNFWGSVGASGSVSANVNTNGALTACGNG